jgi:hypothetical protein
MAYPKNGEQKRLLGFGRIFWAAQKRTKKASLMEA